jgi:DNA (cytosine-5)-methyltransferase 3A
VKVLSLFDGMSCGQLALQKLGIKVDTYYASEIDKYAMQVVQTNFPDTIQVGDISKLDPSNFKDIDLILAGSPCQGFSFAGKQLAFDDPRSALFFEFIRLLKAIKPKYFLLENVKMKQQYIDVITQQVSECYPDYRGSDLFDSKIEPISINSALLSAQSRQRLYWTNIPNVKQPEDLGIVLKDILEDNVEEHYLAGKNLLKNYQGGNQLNPNYKSQANTIHDKNKKSGVICAGTHGYANGYVETKPIQVNPSKKAGGKQPYIQDRVFHEDGKSHSLTASFADRTNVATKPKQVGKVKDGGQGNREPKVVSGGAFRGRAYDQNGKRKDRDGKSVANQTKQMLELRKDDKSNAITTVGKDSVVVNEELTWRKLTPLECERLQTVPDNYTASVSNTQRYKMLGNGWTVEVIAHILENIGHTNT